MGPTALRNTGDNTNLATSMLKILRPGGAPEAPPGAIKIGRATDNDIVVPDVLASRHHATLIPTTGEIADNRSINGTFVNGQRVDAATLRDGDVVTIGNVDLVFTGGTWSGGRDRGRDPHRRARGARSPGPSRATRRCWTTSRSTRPGTLTAVIGPSRGQVDVRPAGRRLTHPTSGTVAFEGHDIHAEYASLRSRIGMVPQDDVVHGQLTVHQALMYAAELRLPPDTTKEDREQVVAQVLEELEMTQHAETRVDKLSGGQRKRASVAMELLTGPSLLILDEPTSGLDPALDRAVMTMLRQLADAGRVVLVVTHSLTYLDVCDQVLLLAPGGLTAFCGPPGRSARRWAPPTGPTSSARWPATPTKPPALRRPTGPPPPTPGGQPSDDRQAREHQPVAAAVHHRPPAGRLWCPTAATRRSWRSCRSSWACCRCRCRAADRRQRGSACRSPRWATPPTSPARSWCCSTSARSSWAPR
jgi:ABC-type cobalamin/Fe3+-siderophores transport system ATPase subunit